MEKLTGAEQSAETKRKDELAAAIAAKDDVELKLFAKELDVPDVDKLSERKDLIAAIELHEEKVAGEHRARLRKMEDDEAAKVNGADDKRAPDAKAIRALNAEFCRALPEGSRSGQFEPGDDARFTGDYSVKDGKYRVAGSDWVFEIRKGRLLRATRATPENGYGGKGVVAVE